MKRLISIVLLTAAVAGCATSSMKSTPFYSGSERVYTGRVEDRVNLWPIAYYREPALSVLWPIYSQTDDHLAIRPVYSQYKQGGKDAGYDEFNFVWPFCQFDTRHHNHRFFPAFWGSDYFHLFPLLWNDGDSHCLFPIAWWRENEYFNIFPFFWNTRSDLGVLPLFWKSPRRLWIAPSFYRDENLVTFFPFYGRDTSNGELTQWFGPAGYHRGKENADWFFPFYYRDDDSLVTPIYGRDNKERSEWAFPLYYRSASSFVSLPYVSSEKDGTSSWMVPPLLSWGEKSEKESFNAYLLGLGGHSSGPDGRNSQWMLPFFWRDQYMFFTPLAGWDRSVGGSWVFPFYYSDRDEFLSFLYWRRTRERDGRRELASHGTFPFWYADDRSFVSPVYISSDDGKESSWFVPPLLSLGASNEKGWTRCGLLGLGGAHRGTDGAFSDWCFPLYYRDDERFVTPLFGKTAAAQWCFPLWYREKDGKRDDFLSILWCASHQGKESFYFIPPLLTWFDGEGNFFTPLGGALGKERWLLPLWWKDESKFVSLLWCWDWGDDSDTYVVPPLLSWIESSDKDDDKMRFLLGLGGINTTYDGDDDCSWVFPLYYNDDRSFISLPFAHVKDQFTYVTPLLGVTHTEHKKGAWLWPLFGWTSDDRMEAAEAMLDAPTLDAKVKLEKHESEWDGKKHQCHTVKGVDYYVSDSSWRLSGLSTSDRWISWSASDDGKTVMAEDNSDFGNIFAYMSDYNRTVKFDYTTKKKISDKENGESGLFCNLLWHSKHEASKGHEYDMKSILWRFWHYEKLNGDVTVDSFPFFTYDSKTNGFSKTSLCWRLFRNEYDPKTDKRAIDFLFIPIWR